MGGSVLSRLVIVSNRVPAPQATKSAGGLVVGIMDALRDRGGVWFGWSGQKADARSHAPQCHREGKVDYLTVDMTEADYEHYYVGFANGVLWPLFHQRLTAMHFHSQAYCGYQEVNDYFAEQLVDHLRPDDVIWVQDYHLIPLAEKLRKRGVKNSIGFFLHIPFPPADIFRSLPRCETLLQQLSYFNLVGLQTRMDLKNFDDTIEHLTDAYRQSDGSLIWQGRRFAAGAFPIGIEPQQVQAMAKETRDGEEGQRLKESLHGREMIIGVDRLDYTKGLQERFLAYESFLDRYLDRYENKVVYLQITPPSRSDVEEYVIMTEELEREAGHVNGRYNDYAWMPLRYINNHFERDTILGFLSMARVGLVTPLRDGMNLVAKEFVAAQDPDDPGVLVLSRLAGAAEEMPEAIIVNPYDTEQVADGIERALAMPLEERKQRWQALMQRLENASAHHWRQKFLQSLKRITEHSDEAVMRNRMEASLSTC